MSADDKDSIQDGINGIVQDGVSGVQDQAKEQVNKAKNMLNDAMFWKKDKTQEEIQAEVQKKYDKIEKKYQKAIEKAAKAETDEEKRKAEEKAAQKRDKSLKYLQEKYPDEYAVIASAQKEKENKDAVVAEQGVADNENATVEKKKTFWQKMTSWMRKKTDRKSTRLNSSH